MSREEDGYVFPCVRMYFMVKERVNSDRRQMWSQPERLRIKNDWDKTEDQGREGHFSTESVLRLQPQVTQTANSFPIDYIITQLHKVKGNLRKAHTTFVIVQHALKSDL